jgi:hypothetical protein
MAIIETPDFNWTGFYYAEILESLVKYKREFVPELSDESKFSVGMQLLSAFALVGHLGSSKAETLANETFLSTAKLTDSVRAHLRLIGYEMRSARPARADVIFQLSGVLTSTKSIVPEGAVVSTESDPPVYFENVDELECEATDAFYGRFCR